NESSRRSPRAARRSSAAHLPELCRSECRRILASPRPTLAPPPRRTYRQPLRKTIMLGAWFPPVPIGSFCRNLAGIVDLRREKVRCSLMRFPALAIAMHSLAVTEYRGYVGYIFSKAGLVSALSG